MLQIATPLRTELQKIPPAFLTVYKFGNELEH
jgi:hypothetical protein